MSTDVEGAEALAPALGDSLEHFCADLRQLRDDYPTKVSLNTLAERSGVPKSTLSSVMAGKKLPTEKTLTAIVKALDGNTSLWLARRERMRLATFGIMGDAADPTATATPDGNPSSSDNDSAAQPSAVLRPRWLLVLLLVIALLIGGGAGAGIAWRVMPPKDPRIPGIVHTGDDPALQPPCLADVVVGASATRLQNYLLEIKWSATCRAAWGRVSRYDDKALGNRIMVTLFLRDDPDGPATQRSDDADTQVSYTYLIADTGVGGTICAKGAVTDGPVVIDLGEPICL